MSTLKKILALSLALAMILSVSVFAGNYSADTYKDAAAIDKDAAEAVELLYALKVMTGDEKGNFNPNATITRAEVAKMIYVILNYGKDDKATAYAAANLFTDVPATAWYAGYINYLAALGLVNGSEGKFYPTNPVKTAEAAKMLLTAIGYNAEDRQYVGANWAKNVLNDASIVGLLAGYKADINGAAPRQWVAVMFNNALLEAYTYKTVVPAGFNGIFTGAQKSEFELFGKKFYGLEQLTGVAVASSNATIHEGASVAGSGKATFLTDDGNVTVKGTGLGYMDLGQEYRVIYKKGSTNVAYSCCLTGESVVAEARVMDITVDINYKTDNNDAYNKYVFTVDGEEFMLPKNGGAVRELAVYPQANQGATASTKHIVSATMATNLVNKIAAIGNQAMTAKVIDADGNGTVDYVIAVTYQYACVDDVVVNDKYGEYAVVKMVNGANLKYSNNAKLYVDDCIVDAPELEEGNYLKYTWNPDAEMFVVEILDVIEDAKYEKRNMAKHIYMLDGEEYLFADNGWTSSEGDLRTSKMKETLTIVVDGDLLVYVTTKDSSYTDMADVNDQLALVLDADDEFSNGYIRNTNGIKYMTIDGETHVAEYYDNTKTDKQGNYLYVQFSEIAGLENQNVAANRLFILHKSGSKVYLEKLNDADVNDQLSASTKILNGYVETAAQAYSELDATKTVKLDGNKIAEDNLFFVKTVDKDGDVEYKVMALSDLKGGADGDAYAQVLTLSNTSGTRVTVVGGYVAFDLQNSPDTGYLYVTEVGDFDNDPVLAMFPGKTDAVEITVENLSNGQIVTDVLYSYSYNALEDEYTLTMVAAHTNGSDFLLSDQIVDFIDDVIYVDPANGARYTKELDDEVIAVLNVELNRDTASETEKDPLAFSVENKGIEFVKLADLTTDMVENEVIGKTYSQYTDAIYRVGDLFYVIRYSVMNECQEDANFNQNELYKELEQIGIELWK